MQNEFVKSGIEAGSSVGTALAMVTGYTTWHCMGWAIVHGLFGWVCAIYFLLCYSEVF